MDLHLSAQCVTPCKIVLSAECDSAFLADDLFHCSTLSTVKLGPDWSTYQSWSEFVTTVLPLTSGEITSVLVSPLTEDQFPSEIWPGQVWPAAQHQLRTVMWCELSVRQLGPGVCPGQASITPHHHQYLLPPPRVVQLLSTRPPPHTPPTCCPPADQGWRVESGDCDCLSISPCVVAILVESIREMIEMARWSPQPNMSGSAPVL